jgi:hypothetical protein
VKHHLNYANTSNFYVQFTGMKDDNLKYYLISTKMPDMQFGVLNIIREGKMLYLPSDSIDTGTIELEFIVDDDFYVYTDLLELQKAVSSGEREDLGMSLIILDNDKNVKLKFDFSGISFSFISGPLFTTQEQQTEMITQVTVNFESHRYERK